MNYYYKLADMEDDAYSEYIATNKECKNLITQAVEKWQDCDSEIEDSGCDNTIEYVEYVLQRNDIDYKILKFDEDNTIIF